MMSNLDPEVEILARIIYSLNPDRQPWDGDAFVFNENHTWAGQNTKLAVKQAKAIIDSMSAEGKRKKGI